MKTLSLLKLTWLIGVAILFFSCAQNTDWPEWRGPNRDGKVTAFNTPSEWPAALSKVWQTEVGLCNSSPVLVGDKIWLHVKQDTNEVALCIDKNSGNQIWRTVLNPAPEVTGGARPHPGPRSTPAVANGKVFMLGTGGIFSCLNAETGKVIWKTEKYTEVPQFYTATSPLVVENKCIIHLGGSENGVIIAFDAETGDEIWKIQGEPCTYSSPVLMELDKEFILVVQSETDILGLTLDGQELFKIPTPAERRFYNSTTPVINGSNIILAGQGSGTRSFQIEKSGDSYTFTENWNNPDFGGSFNTPALTNGYLYGNEARFGSLYCLNAETGETCWADTTKYNRFASTLDLGAALLSLPATGEMIIYNPTPDKYDEVIVYKVAETDVYAHPLLEGKKIYIKDEENLTCWSFN